MIKKRCHFSVIFESLWHFWAGLLMLIFTELDTLVQLVKEEGIDGVIIVLAEGGIYIVLGILVIVAFMLGVPFLRWRKTWITLDENLIIVERNTLKKVKNTIAIEKISTINTERSLFQRMVGTSRIKIDTNTATTATETDVSIVFKKKEAEEFRRLVLEKIKNPAVSTVSTTDQEKVREAEQDENGRQVMHIALDLDEVPKDVTVFHYSTGKLLSHCFYSMPILSLLITLAGVGGCVWFSMKFGFMELINFIFEGAFAAVLVFLGAAWNLVKQYITYHGFTAYRYQGEIRLKYGLLKQRSFNLPVNKITNLSVSQPLLSRIFKRYHAEIVTVGVGNDEAETSNLTLSLSEAEFRHQMAVLLPEYMGDVDFVDLEREKKESTVVRLAKLAIWALVLALTAMTLIDFGGLPAKFVWIGAGGLLLLIGCMFVLSHFAAGYRLGNKYAAFSTGLLTRTVSVCAYEKMQNIDFNVHPLAKKYGMISGVVFMLNNAIAIPYVEEQVAWMIFDKMMKKVNDET